jgi:hypothetical protein
MHLSKCKFKKGFRGNLVRAKIGLAFKGKTRKVQLGFKGAKMSPCRY